MRRSPLLAAVVLLALSACRRDEGPDAAYRTFAAAARAGDVATVWALLSQGSRAAFDARSKVLAAELSGVAPEGRDLVLGDLSAGAPRIEAVEVLHVAGGEAVVGVRLRGAPEAPPAEVRLVREGGAWRVVVP